MSSRRIYMQKIVRGQLVQKSGNSGRTRPIALHCLLTRSVYKDIVDIRLRPRSGAAPSVVSLSICQSDKSMLLPTKSLLRRLFRAIMHKHDVIPKTGSR